MSFEKIEKEVSRKIREATGASKASALGDLDNDPNIYSEYKHEFRASRLPFCPREYVIHHRYPDTVLRSESYNFRFYVGIGTAVHEVIQQFMGMAKMLYGHWICCGVIEKDRLGSRLCPVCGRPQKYEEYEITSELGAHVDGVYQAYNAVTEFKTTGEKNMDLLEGPYPAHLTQASTYVEALNDQYGWSLDKIIFVYLSRDNPANFRVFVVKPLKGVYQGALDLYEGAQKSLQAGELPDGICATPSDGAWISCPYVSSCFSPDVEDKLIPVSQLSRGSK